MITGREMIKKLGKDNFVKFALQNKDKEKTGAELAHGRRWGRNVKDKLCEHGVWVIKNYEPQECDKCTPETEGSFSIKENSHEYFNAGTGSYGTNSEHRKFAKARGMGERG